MGKYIFLEGLSYEENIQAGFRKDFVLESVGKNISLKVTARTFYRVYVNGRFAFHGPARSAHNYARIDIINIGGLVVEGNNTLAIEVAGYNQGNQYTTGESSFLFAELSTEDGILTGTDTSWYGVRLKARRQHVEKFSHARCANELYDLEENYISWRTEPVGSLTLFPVEELELNIQLLERGVSNPEFNICDKYKMISVCNVAVVENLDVPDFFYEKGTCAKEESLYKPERPAVECARERTTAFTGIIEYETNDCTKDMHIMPMGVNCAVSMDFDRLYSSFIGIEFTCKNDMIVDLKHGDRLTDEGDIKARTDDGCNCVIRLYCSKGYNRFESFEPYSVRYLQVILRNCEEFVLHRVYLREYQYSENNKGTFLCSDTGLNRIYTAARETFKLNTLDIFMDCPGRERGGWLNDSFWSGRVERLMFGDTSVNKAMLENFLLSPSNWDDRGLFPSCYPASKAGKDIPNWSMFLVLQLYEYYRFSGDRDLVDRFEPRLELLVDGLAQYENREGLLEKLQDSIFIDWSSANNAEYKGDISVPTNALYALMLEKADSLYGRPDWRKKAGKIKDILNQKAVSGDRLAPGKFFSDSLTHDAEGNLIPGRFFSEACQYYCFWTDTADILKYSEIFKTLLTEYGTTPEKYQTNIYVAKANLFIGQFIRFDLLSKYGEYEVLLREMRRLFTYMIDNGPGTLWEILSDYGSICHGFAAHAGVWLMKDFLGLGTPDEIDKKIKLAPNPCGMKWAKGSVATGSGLATLSWYISDARFELYASIPQGYSAEVILPKEVMGWDSMKINGSRVEQRAGKLDGFEGSIDVLIVNKKEAS